MYFDFIRFDNFKLEDPLGAAIGSAVFDGNEASTKAVKVDLHCEGQLGARDWLVAPQLQEGIVIGKVEHVWFFRCEERCDFD